MATVEETTEVAEQENRDPTDETAQIKDWAAHPEFCQEAKEE